MLNTERETTETLDIKFNDQGLVPAIVQDIDTGQILMMGWQNAEALKISLETRKATFFARSRKRLWTKGESTGHFQQIVDIRVDCDQDTVLMRCKSLGPCCHAGYQTCFYRQLTPTGQLSFIEDRAFDPDEKY